MSLVSSASATGFIPSPLAFLPRVATPRMVQESPHQTPLFSAPASPRSCVEYHLSLLKRLALAWAPLANSLADSTQSTIVTSVFSNWTIVTLLSCIHLLSPFVRNSRVAMFSLPSYVCFCVQPTSGLQPAVSHRLSEHR